MLFLQLPTQVVYLRDPEDEAGTWLGALNPCQLLTRDSRTVNHPSGHDPHTSITLLLAQRPLGLDADSRLDNMPTGLATRLLQQALPLSQQACILRGSDSLMLVQLLPQHPSHIQIPPLIQFLCILTE